VPTVAAAVQPEPTIGTAVRTKRRSLNFVSFFLFCRSSFGCVFRVWFRDWGFQVFSYFLQADDEKVHWDTIASLYASMNYPSNRHCKSYAIQKALFNNLRHSYTKTSVYLVQ